MSHSLLKRLKRMTYFMIQFTFPAKPKAVGSDTQIGTRYAASNLEENAGDNDVWTTITI